MRDTTRLPDRPPRLPIAPRALADAVAAAPTTRGGAAEASRHAALRRVPPGPAGGLRLTRLMR
jgi:hypothetical protein